MSSWLTTFVLADSLFLLAKPTTVVVCKLNAVVQVVSGATITKVNNSGLKTPPWGTLVFRMMFQMFCTQLIHSWVYQ